MSHHQKKCFESPLANIDRMLASCVISLVKSEVLQKAIKTFLEYCDYINSTYKNCIGVTKHFYFLLFYTTHYSILLKIKIAELDWYTSWSSLENTCLSIGHVNYIDWRYTNKCVALQCLNWFKSGRELFITGTHYIDISWTWTRGLKIWQLTLGNKDYLQDSFSVLCTAEMLCFLPKLYLCVCWVIDFDCVHNIAVHQ